MPEFTGFKSTTLVGKEDLTLGAAITKKPIGKLPIHEYAVQPSIVSTSISVLNPETISTITEIITNTQYENYLSQINSIESTTVVIKNKVVPTPEAIAEIAIP